VPRHRLVWPLPALLVWLTAWAGWHLARLGGLEPGAALALGGLIGALGAWIERSGWRRLLIGLGFPLAVLLGGPATTLPAWLWPLLLLVLLAAYPVQAWRDAPFFPTPPDALDGLAEQAALPPGAAVLDAGCGLGHGLQALRRVYPAAQLHGIESSRLLRFGAAWRCRAVRELQLRHGDMWAHDWQPYQLVYLFQRPESMAQAAAKAQREMAPGSWLVSLEFSVPDLQPWAVLARPGTRPVWIYRIDHDAGPATGHDAQGSGAGRTERRERRARLHHQLPSTDIKSISPALHRKNTTC
jgi:SAM-dependent methyltransferase